MVRKIDFWGGGLRLGFKSCLLIFFFLTVKQLTAAIQSKLGAVLPKNV